MQMTFCNYTFLTLVVSSFKTMCCQHNDMDLRERNNKIRINNSQLSKVLDHQMTADVKENFLYIILYISIIFKWQIHKDDFSKLNFSW